MPITLNIRLNLVLVLLLMPKAAIIHAQAQTRLGILPSVNYNHKVNNDWEVNFRFESRHFIFEDYPSRDDDFKYQYSLSDFSTLIGRKTGLHSKVVLGVLARAEPDALSYRVIQQFIFQTTIQSFRVAHRISTDQTFSSTEYTEFRIRYRLSLEIPLSGLKVDVKEFYFKLNAEAINSVQDRVYDLEFRVVPNIGYVINGQQNIELGLDNRFDSFIDNQTRLNTWITITWFL